MRFYCTTLTFVHSNGITSARNSEMVLSVFLYSQADNE